MLVLPFSKLFYKFYFVTYYTYKEMCITYGYSLKNNSKFMLIYSPLCIRNRTATVFLFHSVHCGAPPKHNMSSLLER